VKISCLNCDRRLLEIVTVGTGYQTIPNMPFCFHRSYSVFVSRRTCCASRKFVVRNSV